MARVFLKIPIPDARGPTPCRDRPPFPSPSLSSLRNPTAARLPEQQKSHEGERGSHSQWKICVTDDTQCAAREQKSPSPTSPKGERR